MAYGRLIGLLLLVAVTLSASSHGRWFHVTRDGTLALERPIPPPLVTGASAALYDLTNGRFLLTHEAHRTRLPGSLTKIVTAMVVLEQTESIDPIVQVSRDAALAPGAHLLLEVGELIGRDELIKALLLLPGTDAAIALAEHVSGSVPRFVADMNAWVQRLDLEQTRFENPHGLDTSGHRTTAYDVAQVAAQAMQHETFRALVAMRGTTLNRSNGRNRYVRNVNSFLWRYPDAIGIKSSYTPESGYSLVGAARRNGVELLVVVLGAPSSKERYEIASALLDYGFAHYDTLREEPVIERVKYVVREGDTLTGIARAFGISPQTIQKFNGISDSDRLRVGEELWIPK